MWSLGYVWPQKHKIVVFHDEYSLTEKTDKNSYPENLTVNHAFQLVYNFQFVVGDKLSDNLFSFYYINVYLK